MGVETIDDVEKVVIEPMSHFFNNTVIIDLSARIEPETIEKRVDTEFIFNTIKIGYNSFDYRQLGGIFEYNVANNYTTTIKPVSKQLKILSDYRSDISGVILLEKEPVENRDAAGEGNIFILDSVRNGGSNWIVRTIEGFENSSNLGNLDVLINVLLSPARNIRRWGAYIRGFLNKYVTTDLIWQTSGKNTMLSSTLTDEATIVENANIPVEELDTPFWHPETFTVEVPASNADIEAIKANPYGLVKLTADEYGYILDYKSKNENKKSTFKLLRCNTQYLSPSDQPFPGSVVITKVITGLPSDMKSFGVTITESTTGVSYITKISQFAPVTVLLPYGSYTIVELPRIGYTTGISVVPDTIILNGDNPSEAILITNEKN